MENFPIYTPVQLLGTFSEDAALPMFWKTLGFNQTPIYSDDRSIEFSKTNTLRKVAPFVSPKSEGRPIYSKREAVSRVTTAYIKLKDSVSPSDFTGKREIGAGELGAAGQRAPLTPQQRYDYRVAEITRQHTVAIDNRIEIMCFEAIANGVVEVRDDETNTVDVVDFGRDPSHTITLLAGARWNEAGVNPLDSFTAWKRLARRPKGNESSQRHGAAATLWVMGREAAEAFRKNEEVRKELDTNYVRASQTVINTGALEGLDIEYIGKLNNGDDVWMYNEYVEDEDGNLIEIMDPRDVIGINAPAMNGQLAYGTIENFKANLGSLDRFPSMFANTDGSAHFLQNEAAPMVFPVNPNATLRARVIA
jgi:predicted lactoylglutathione lyase